MWFSDTGTKERIGATPSTNSSCICSSCLRFSISAAANTAPARSRATLAATSSAFASAFDCWIARLSAAVASIEACVRFARPAVRPGWRSFVTRVEYEWPRCGSLTGCIGSGRSLLPCSVLLLIAVRFGVGFDDVPTVVARLRFGAVEAR